MEAAPPSYETATLVDVWDIISRYIPGNDLCSAALVCSRWHNIFTPHIWGNPASHFGIENDAVYVALVRFKRTLPTARLWVRSMTHTLHLPPAHAEIYNGPNADWLRGILEHLPNLQSLIVRGLPFFDHGALQALRIMRKTGNEDTSIPRGVIELPGSSVSVFQTPSTNLLSFGLRLLDASRCPNVTSDGLGAALRRFEGLIYLDLSFTYPARERVVINALREFSGLQVLKMRGIGLRDDGIQALSEAIGLRVRSLDVRDNRVTDRGVRTLLDDCFIPRAAFNEETLSPGQRSPALLPYLGSEMLDIYQGEDFEGFLRNAFTGRFVSRLAIEDAPAGGITHLYIAGNALSVEGISGLIRSERLHVLDVGSLTGRLAGLPNLQAEDGGDFDVPGPEKLTPILSKYAADAMTFLRIDHSIITRETPCAYPDEIVPGRLELGDTPFDPSSRTAELDGRSVEPEAFEAPTDPQSPRYELAGDPMHIMVSPAINDPPHDIHDSSDPDTTRRGSVFAPEVVDEISDGVARTSFLSPVSPMSYVTSSGGGLTAVSPVSQDWPTISGASCQRPRSPSMMAIERRARLNAHVAQGHNFHPAMVPHLKTLVLTNVPTVSTDLDVANRIIRFVTHCAQEAALARETAKYDYALPPGRRGHASALRQSADKIFALHRIVIELALPQGVPRNGRASSWKHLETKSMTDDRDTEALWSAAETDFSFFGDEECGLPTVAPGRFAISSEKEVNFGQPVRRDSKPVKAPSLPQIDTVSQLSGFRKDRKLAHQRNVAAGNLDAENEGYWDGVIQVVHPGNGLKSDEETDYYGNKFTNNYLYR